MCTKVCCATHKALLTQTKLPKLPGTFLLILSILSKTKQAVFASNECTYRHRSDTGAVSQRCLLVHFAVQANRASAGLVQKKGIHH